MRGGVTTDERLAPPERVQGRGVVTDERPSPPERVRGRGVTVEERPSPPKDAPRLGGAESRDPASVRLLCEAASGGRVMLEARDLHFSYDHRPVLAGLDLQVAAGELCAILGNNGVGKSTLLKCLLGILSPQQGRVLLEGDDAAGLGRREVARRMAYVAQQIAGGERLTVFDVVLMGRRPHITWAVRDHDLEVVREVIETLGLSDFALRYVDELSGGEAQKVVIARALAQEPSVLVLDEPTSNLDLRNQLDVMQAVREAVVQRGIGALMAIHDINLALRFADRFILLKDGAVLACGGTEVITSESVYETYGVRTCIERLDGRMLVIPED